MVDYLPEFEMSFTFKALATSQATSSLETMEEAVLLLFSAQQLHPRNQSFTTGS